MRRWGVALVFLAGLALGQNQAEFALRLEQAWRLVKERYYDPNFKGVDWAQVGQAYRYRLGEVKSWEELYRLLDEMYGELNDGHSRVLSPAQARSLGGQACQPLPFKDQDLLPLPSPPTAPPYLPPPPKPLPQAPALGLGDFEAQLLQGVVVIRLGNLLESQGPALLRQAVRRYEPQARGYLLDLRDNPGGLVLHMAEAAGVFMRGVPWRLVGRGLGAVPLPTLPFLGPPTTQKPLAVLINGQTHSAAEGLAGALKNARRAYLVGTRSAGNTEALVPYCFPDGGVALVAAGVLAPLSGPTWEGRGVEPDQVEERPEAQLEAALRHLRQR
ncbi:peptidase S41 [Meiothermus sp. QL-1]|uniref:S41 family peptidase n=1 Tax=Meiothermus sp. QL-1 TaxID=2058095 RepID=UPI000E0CA0C5|nr:S41 family peptidase [Meiothermus sp. QL-1]RDI96389.1 peptidase S41 [Meiothermus sp. QL-1]